MIASIRGILLIKEPGRVVVDVGGVGYMIQVSLPTFENLPETGAETTLLTHLHVREDALQLFGFSTMAEKDLFNMLTTVSGVGPKLALGILSASRVAELRMAIESEDVSALSRLPGLGRKTASKVILELKGKLPESRETLEPGGGGLFDEALSALLNLGYKKSQAESALKAVSPIESLEAAITGALKVLAPSGT